MKKENKTFQESRALPAINALSDLITALLMLMMAPVFLGIVTGISIVGIIPWMIPALILYLLVLIFQYHNKDMIGFISSSLLTFIALFQNLFRALIELYCFTHNVKISSNIQTSFLLINNIALIVCGIIFTSVVILVSRTDKVTALILLIPCIGFFCFGFSFFLPSIAPIGGWLMITYGIIKLFIGFRTICFWGKQ